ncbi:Protein of unknown function DUF3743 [Penicillium atrosanguineum]|uniref:Protein of unknown function DUF3743 n=1 Tax=Penicillium atrosanguineum TaxID=1132637 RepID=UPI00238C329D|nr:Protein of unknown function DUF3743 [Penicillium atrosanguineum]KAJ5289466.1 Protein of unknown function DUF3743 [Penicillium atrosanguineum]
MPTKTSKRTSLPEKTSTPQIIASITNNTELPSLNPTNITPQIFHSLLNLYPQTVTAVHNRKNTLKLQPKPKTTKRKAEDLERAQSERTPSLEDTVRSETEKFLELDTWRYEGMPQILSERKSKSDGREGYVDKVELIRIMEWKLCVPSPLALSMELDPGLHTKNHRKHGHFRPTLMSMIKSNAEKLVLECTSSAISLLPGPNSTPSTESEGDVFPKESLDALTRLRGVGVATASLVLSIATAASADADEVPFYSDDTFRWLCAACYPGSEDVARKYLKPNGDLGVKYNVNEYRLLWDKMGELRGEVEWDG